MQLLGRLFQILAPHQCLGCGCEGSLLCESCGRRLPAPPAFPGLPKGIDTAWAITVYDGAAKQLVHSLKFERAAGAAHDIARLLAARLPEEEWVITAAPTVPARVRERGYDQAALIARQLARLTRRPYASLLARSGSERQVGKKRSVRLAQLRHAFRPLHEHQIQGQHILLVDDVLTTGASLQAAAAALNSAGAARVSAAVFAFTPLPSSK